MRAALIGVLAVAAMALGASSASAAPWPCDSTGYVVQEGGVFGSDSVFGPFTRQADGTYGFTPLFRWPGEALNALAFRPQDGNMYAWNNTTQRLERITRDPATGNAIVTDLIVPGMPVFGSFVGTILDDGTYFVWGTPSNPTGFIIDVSGPTPTLIASVSKDPSWDYATYPLGDVAVSPVDGQIYAAVGGEVHRLTLSGTGPTRTFALGAPVGTGGGTGSGGAQWFEPRGAQGTLMQISGAYLWATDMATGTLTSQPLAQIPAQGDGASCPNSIAVTKDASPRTVTAGTELTYTYTVTARGLVDNPVDFTDTLPAGMTYVPGGVTVNGTFGPPNGYGGTDTLSVSGVIPRNTTVTIAARVRVSPEHACDVDAPNQASATMHAAGFPDVTVTSDDPTTASSPDPTVVHVVCAADPRIEKSATSALVAGEDATYNLKVTNNGPSAARNVRVADKLPSALSFKSASSGCSGLSGLVTCTLASLEPGESHTFTVTVHVASSADSCSDVRNTATVTNDVVDTDLTNNSSTVCDFKRRSDLKITKDASRTQVPQGGQVMYTLVVENLGPSDDSNVKVSDPTPAGLSLVSAKPSQGFCSTTGGKVSCSLGTLVAGGSAQILVTANVTAASTGSCSTSTITNTATASGDSFDPTPENNEDSAQVCVPPGPDPKFDLAVAKTASAKSVYVGQGLTYKVTVTNKGPDAAPNAKVTDTLNHPASVVSVKATQGSCSKSIPMTCQLGTVKAGGKVTITVVVKLRDSGCKQRNAASATGEGTDTNPANNLARVDVCAKPVPLRLTKVADRHTLRAGSLVGYTIRVSNPSAGEAKDVKVCDKLPSGLVYVSSKAKAKFHSGQYCWTIKRLGAHKSQSFRITVRALGSASGDRVNHATASAQGAKTRHAKDPVRVLAARASGGGVTG